MSISNKALLVNLTIRQWIGRRIDKRATTTVEVSHSTATRVGNYTKKLLPDAKELEEVTRLAGAIRVWFYEQTLPWATDGSRILKSQNFLDFTSTFRAKKSEFDKAVNEFIYRYPTLKDEAKFNKLGDLYKDSDYPDVNSLLKTFECDISFYPVPDVNDFRVELSDYEKQAFLDSMAKVEREAVRECWTRLHTVVSKAVTKLSDPSSIFRDSLIENIQEMCTLLPKLNVTDDASLETMRQDIQTVIAKISPDTCRINEHVRNEAALKLDDILGKMSAYMG